MQEEPFIVTKNLDDDILVIKLHGKMDVVTTPQFSAEVQQHFDQGKHRIIIDCAHLGYINSMGIGALVSLHTRLRKQGGEVKLAAIQGPVAEVLRIVRLDKMLSIYGDTEFARQSFQESQQIEDQ